LPAICQRIRTEPIQAPILQIIEFSPHPRLGGAGLFLDLGVAAERLDEAGREAVSL